MAGIGTDESNIKQGNNDLSIVDAGLGLLAPDDSNVLGKTAPNNSGILQLLDIGMGLLDTTTTLYPSDPNNQTQSQNTNVDTSLMSPPTDSVGEN